jgi:hypothetical protein
MPIFPPMPPVQMLPIVCLGSIALAGCGYDEGYDLPAVAQLAAPARAHAISCSGSSGLIDYPARDCAYIVRGSGSSVTEELAQRLRRAGFDVSCARAGSLAALRGNVRVDAEVTQYGSFIGSNVFASGYRPLGARSIPRGSVVLKLSAIRQAAASASFWRSEIARGGSCDRALPTPNRIALCLVWWNGPAGFTTSRAAVRRRLGPELRVERSERPGVSSCTYTLRNGPGFVRASGRFDQGGWRWSPLRRVQLEQRFRPNARLAESGWLSAGT